MNKKRLSVVMAGAMLASSVAPVMAAEVSATNVSANELGLLQEEVRELVESARFANETVNGSLANESIYAVYFNKEEQKMLTADAKTDVWQARFNSLRVGDVVRVYTKGAKLVNDKYYHAETKVDVPRYTKDELKELPGIFERNDLVGEGKLMEKVSYDDRLNEVVIVYNDSANVPGVESSKSVSIKENDQKIKLTEAGVIKYIDNENKEQFATVKVPTPDTFKEFVLDDTKTTKPVPYPTELVKEYVITPGGYNFDVADLYDGLFLTDKGNEFFGMLKDNLAAKRGAKLVLATEKGTNKPTVVYTLSGSRTEENIKDLEKEIYDSLKDYKGTYRFEIRLAAGEVDSEQLKEEIYTISGKDKQEVARLASWMLKPQARVDKFEGANRYETAALIAREYAGLTRNSVHEKNKDLDIKGEVNIVLVNGDALVDGLAAAPLAATKANKVKGVETSAPVLLTYADRLPKETKAYLREVLSNIALGDVPNVTINLVGGESVLNKSLEKELKAIGFHGFTVERFGGDNREETSLEVAKEIGTDKAFVVGGEGEADAMSIASVAATQKTPIIVAKKGGISEDGLYEVRDRHVTIVGGKTVVTAAEEKEIRTEAASVNRIPGANRKATNAEVIKRYYNKSFANGVGNAQNVIVAKDGQRREIDLVDALAAANMASEKKAPIVLATNKLSKEQEAAINSYANDAYGLFQVGGQVERSVVKTIAKMLNLTNRNTK